MMSWRSKSYCSNCIQRKNDLRFYNLKNTKTGTASYVDCESIVIKLCDTYGVDITIADIANSHHIGNVAKKDHQLFVKFSSIRTRNKLFLIKSQLRYSGIVVGKEFQAKILEREKISPQKGRAYI